MMRQIPLRTLVNRVGGKEKLLKLSRQDATTAFTKVVDEIKKELSLKGIDRTISSFSEFIETNFPVSYTFDPATLANPANHILELAERTARSGELSSSDMKLLTLKYGFSSDFMRLKPQRSVSDLYAACLAHPITNVVDRVTVPDDIATLAKERDRLTSLRNDSDTVKSFSDLRRAQRDLSLAKSKYMDYHRGVLPDFPTMDDLVKIPELTDLVKAVREAERVHKSLADTLAHNLDELANVEQRIIEVNKQLTRQGESLIRDVLAYSEVAQRASDEFSRLCRFAPGTLNHLENTSNYTEDKLRSDLAEFFKLVHGRITPVIFMHNTKSTRAGTSDTGDKATVIFVGNGFTKTTLFHELGHNLEYVNPVVKDVANAFLQRRKTSDKPVPLKKLTSLPYEPSERAYPDNFIDPYVGKYYEAGSTEVISMGVEKLAVASDAARFASQDPEHFKLVLGALAGKPSDVVQYNFDVMNSRRLADMERLLGTPDKPPYDTLLSRANDYIAKFKPDTDHVLGSYQYEFSQFVLPLYLRKSKSGADPKYLGRVGKYHFYKGSVLPGGRRTPMEVVAALTIEDNQELIVDMDGAHLSNPTTLKSFYMPLKHAKALMAFISYLVVKGTDDTTLFTRNGKSVVYNYYNEIYDDLKVEMADYLKL